MHGPLLIVVLVGGGLAVVVGLILFSLKQERQRTAELEALADDMSLSFSPLGNQSLESDLSHMSLMQRGHSRKLFNHISGETQSVELDLFDYRYTTGSGKHQTTHTLSVVAFTSPLLDLPPFELGPENFLHRLAGAFGYQDIDFGGYPTFNKKYLLRGQNEKSIRKLFTEPVLNHFEAQLAAGKGVCEVIGHRSRLIVAKRREKPARLRAFLEDAFATYGVLKSDASEV